MAAADVWARVAQRQLGGVMFHAFMVDSCLYLGLDGMATMHK